MKKILSVLVAVSLFGSVFVASNVEAGFLDDVSSWIQARSFFGFNWGSSTRDSFFGSESQGGKGFTGKFIKIERQDKEIKTLTGDRILVRPSLTPQVLQSAPTTSTGTISGGSCPAVTCPTCDCPSCATSAMPVDGFCEGGVCCKDSDGGKNWKEKGSTIIYEEKGNYLETFTDKSTETGVIEYFCQKGIVLGMDIEACPAEFLKDGACLEIKCAKEGETSNPSLGPDYYVPCCDGLQPFTPNTLSVDMMVGSASVCYDPSKGEPTCENIDTKGEGWYQKDLLLQYAECGSGTLPPSGECTDTDNGLDYYLKGSVSHLGRMAGDVCLNETVLSERYCLADNVIGLKADISASSMASQKYECKYGCVDGACQKERIVTSCVDTDKGKDYYTSGYAYLSGRLSEAMTADQCVNSNTLLEVYCGSGLSMNMAASSQDILTEKYTCKYGCEKGACLATPPVSTTTCTDSDGGVDVYKAGSVTISKNLFESAEVAVGKQTQTTYIDVCTKGGVMEHSCSGDTVKKEEIACPLGCSGGACVSKLGEGLPEEARLTK